MNGFEIETPAPETSLEPWCTTTHPGKARVGKAHGFRKPQTRFPRLARKRLSAASRRTGSDPICDLPAGRCLPSRVALRVESDSRNRNRARTKKGTRSLLGQGSRGLLLAPTRGCADCRRLAPVLSP